MLLPAFDGYPLAQQGRAGLAIGASATASAVGRLDWVLVTLMLFIPLAKEIVSACLAQLNFCCLRYPGLGGYCGFFPWQVASRGLIAGGFGLMFAFVGVDTCFWSYHGLPWTLIIYGTACRWSQHLTGLVCD